MRTLINNVDSFVTCRKSKLVEKLETKKPGAVTVETFIWIFIIIVLIVIVYSVLSSIFGDAKTATNDEVKTLFDTIKSDAAGGTGSGAGTGSGN